MRPASHFIRRLIAARQTLATAESCTGGLIAHTLTNIPGASVWFKGGVVAYADTAKSALLKVAPALIRRHGAVSAPVAKAMAQGIRRSLDATFAVATTGIAGPSGGTPEKPVGLVFIAAASPRRTIVRKFLFKGTRSQIKRQTLAMAMALLKDACVNGKKMHRDTDTNQCSLRSRKPKEGRQVHVGLNSHDDRHKPGR